MELTEIINWSMVFGVFFAHITLVVCAVFWLSGKKDFFIFKILKEKGMLFAYLISIAGVLGSLYYSEIVGYAPCVLCWYQRIFMYSNVFILGLALYKGGDKNSIPYAMILACVGGFISIYHNLLFLPAFKEVDTTCSPFSNISCTESYFTGLGYINIPVIALTSFALIIILLTFAKKK